MINSQIQTMQVQNPVNQIPGQQFISQQQNVQYPTQQPMSMPNNANYQQARISGGMYGRS